jgi:hypothetical protein
MWIWGGGSKCSEFYLLPDMSYIVNNCKPKTFILTSLTFETLICWLLWYHEYWTEFEEKSFVSINGELLSCRCAYNKQEVGVHTATAESQIGNMSSSVRLISKQNKSARNKNNYIAVCNFVSVLWRCIEQAFWNTGVVVRYRSNKIKKIWLSRHESVLIRRRFS